MQCNKTDDFEDDMLASEDSAPRPIKSIFLLPSSRAGVSKRFSLRATSTIKQQAGGLVHTLGPEKYQNRDVIFNFLFNIILFNYYLTIDYTTLEHLY